MRRLVPVVLLFLLVAVPSAGAWTWPVRGPLLETFLFDPAHPYASGQHRGVAIGADGLILEVHPCPEKAISDGAQSLTLESFWVMMSELKPFIALWKESRAVPA